MCVISGAIMINQDIKDRRVIKTTKAIKNAFALLISEKDVNQITVKEIAETADINRNTFYNYYSGIHEIIEEIENETVENLRLIISGVDISQGFEEIFDQITFAISSDIDFFTNLFVTNKDFGISTKITSMLKELLKNDLVSKTNIPMREIETLLDYSLAGVISLYNMWFNSERDETINTISKTCCGFFTSNVNFLIDKYSNKIGI